MAPRKPKSPEPEAAPQPKPRVRRKAIPAPPSLPEPPPARKPSRRPLWIAFGLAGMVILAVSALWVWARGEAIKGLDAGAEVLRRAGYEVTWKDRSVGGYPFRINVALEEPRIRDRSGWALEAPRLEAQAFLHAPGHWLAAAPDGATFTRPEGGPVRVNGELIRASLTHLDKHPPNLSFEGVDLTFEPAPGAQAFGLASAGRVEFHLRRAPAEVGDEAGVWLSVKDGKARLPALLGRLAGDKPVSLEWDGRMTKIDALRGETWRGAVRAWTAAGGTMRVTRGGLTAGDALIGVNGGSLRAGFDGRLQGVLDLSLRQAPRALGVLADTGAVSAERAAAAVAVAEARGSRDLARATLNFEAGQTTLGPVALAPAPKVYEAY
jgi:hypothetical protein